MFEDEARRFVAKWSPILLVQDWRVELEFTTDLGDNLALTHTNEEKQDALIQIASDWEERVKRATLKHADLEETVVHELLHVKDAPFRAAIENILSTHMSASELESVEAMLRQMRERAIDSLATGLVQAFRRPL